MRPKKVWMFTCYSCDKHLVAAPGRGKRRAVLSARMRGWYVAPGRGATLCSECAPTIKRAAGLGG